MNRLLGDIVVKEAAAIGIEVTADQARLFDSYAAELLKWNAKVNLTAITRAEEIAIKHFVDSLPLVRHLSADDRLLDIGSGAGVPVIPLKIMLPKVLMTSVDAVAKKIHFQRHIIRLLNLQNIEAVHSRIEKLQHSHQGHFSVITSRAFSRLDHFVDLAAPLLADGGRLLAMKSGSSEDELLGSEAQISAAGFVITGTERYSLPMAMGERTITELKRCQAA